MVYNKVTLIGRLVADPKNGETPKGTATSFFQLAVQQEGSRKKANEEKNAPTADFISCKAYGKTAEIINTYMTKGKLITVDGQIRNDRYEKDGKTHYSQYVAVREVGFLDRKKTNNLDTTVDESDVMENIPGDVIEVTEEGELIYDVPFDESIDEGVAF